MNESNSSGPLQGLRVIEMAGIGPGPFCGMLLADMGAEVIVIERPAALRSLGAGEAMNRGKRSICLDLKDPLALSAAQGLINSADALIEGYRPGVMERLGLGPAVFVNSNPKLVYGRVTGWGQTGPLAKAAGHDINYVALTGALSIAGLIDLAAERTRLSKEIAGLAADIDRTEKKLGNPDFVARAPEEVVEENREKLAEAQAAKARLEAGLARLASVG